MGEVYKARDTRLDRLVAIKILSGQLARDPDAMSRFEREALSVAKLSHPNIVAIYEFGREPGSGSGEPIVFAVTEFVDGETLRAKLANGPLPARRAVAYAHQIARGIAAAHSRGIVHRDLKPENVMVGRDDQVKILDFGLAKPVPAVSTDETRAATAHTAAGVVLGTFAYMAPEQVRGLDVDHRADLFAFGAVVYEMLSGERAFKGETAADTMTAVLSKEPPDLDLDRLSISPALERIVRRCLEKAPDLRFQSANDLAFALETLSTGSTPPPKAGSVAPIRTGRRMARVAVAAVSVAALAAGFGGGWLLANRGAGWTQPTFRRLTFRSGFVTNARFAPDGKNLVYSAIWDSAPERIFPVSVDRPRMEAQSLADASLMAVSATGDLAIRMRPEWDGPFVTRGTLAQMALAGGQPRLVLERVDDAAYAPDGRMAVVRVDRGRSRLELYPGSSVLYETAAWISSPRIARDGSRLAFVEHPLIDDDRGWLVVIDMSTRKASRLTEEYESVTGLAWSPAGDEVCFAVKLTLRCAAIATSSVRVIVQNPLRLQLYDIGPDGRILANGAVDHWRQAVGDTTGREIDLTWQDTPLPIALSHDGTRLLFGSTGYGVFLRELTGGDPVRLGGGMPTSLSPDDRWVLAITPGVPTSLAIVPTGVGETRTLPRGAIEAHSWAAWMPGGRAIVMSANEKGHALRLYLQHVDGGDPVAFTGEGVSLPFLCSNPVSPNNDTVLGEGPDGRPALFSITGGPPRPLTVLGSDLTPVGWSNDPNVIFARSCASARLLDIFRVDITTGARERWRTIGPSDVTGAPIVFWAVVSPDGRQYAYSDVRYMTDLFLIDGVFDTHAAR